MHGVSRPVGVAARRLVLNRQDAENAKNRNENS